MTDLDAVGQTALGVAYVRAVESRRRDALFTDPLATSMFDEVQTEAARWDDGADDTAGERVAMYQSIVGRTLFLDDVCRRAAAAGITQFVILGAGLDARAFRLDLGSECVIFELDRPQVIDVKNELVHQYRPPRKTVRQVVAADLTESWTEELCSAGLRTDRRICWLAEGLFVYLTDDVVFSVIDSISAVSVPGSRVGATLRRPSAHAPGGPFADVSAMWHPDPGIVENFERTGWVCEIDGARRILREHGRAADGPEDNRSQLLVAVRSAAGTPHR
ncbi:SAM-dependent methyltransferase [Gordonia sp. VNQ95]|jgi:methyltransferase (TIGR00027 family)|uniref:SAM-dependent methyltransferase n=1 Tax=Gordonia TaxID=2053 RepID=UPI0032B48C57